MQSFTIDDVDEENANEFFLCRECKKVTHISENPWRSNFVTLYDENGSDSTIVCECAECCKKRLKAQILTHNQRRLKHMKTVLVGIPGTTTHLALKDSTVGEYSASSFCP